jgi:phospholipid/cholesterol/gamma-HCH transport system ATP-binding protein
VNHKIEVKNLTKRFGDKTVLTNINLNINKGISTILGGSGSGKSVFLKIIIGLIEKTNGSISFNGSELKTKADYQNFYKKISVLFQNNALFDSMNIQENLSFPFINDKTKDKLKLKQMCEESLISVGLKPEICSLSISEISGGMQKRVALARAIITKPEMVFLDEPTSGLDIENTKLIFDLIKELSIKFGITFIIITHDIFIAPYISDELFFLENGNFSVIDKDVLRERFKILY